MGVKILFFMIMTLEELFFRCRFGLESLDQIILVGLNGDRFGRLDEYGSVSEVIEFLDEGTDGSVSIIEVGHGFKCLNIFF